ncbi:MAG: redox-sensing transcriptional repressor Rex [Oscillospiraceae bacterium]|nr:redox-sensing transcriptional repressor Rex [Oscillospiraceae bacterium]
MKRKNVSDAVIRRLPRYYRYLDDLHNKGVVRISSNALGNKMGITASQIRQDLSCFGEFGQQGYGYNVDELRTEVGHILGADKQHRIIVIGVGNLGHALIQNFRFHDSGFTLDAAFDISPALIGNEVAGVPVLSMDDLDAYLKNHRVDVAVLTVPRSVAQETANQMIEAGVCGFWNFTNVELSSPKDGVYFEDVHFADSLLTLSYRITEQHHESISR